jgi:hypothetical protein
VLKAHSCFAVLGSKQWLGSFPICAIPLGLLAVHFIDRLSHKLIPLLVTTLDIVENYLPWPLLCSGAYSIFKTHADCWYGWELHKNAILGDSIMQRVSHYLPPLQAPSLQRKLRKLNDDEDPKWKHNLYILLFTANNGKWEQNCDKSLLLSNCLKDSSTQYSKMGAHL